MKIMIVPMAAMAETHGSVSRCEALAYGLKDAGLDVVTCMATFITHKGHPKLLMAFLPTITRLEKGIYPR